MTDSQKIVYVSVISDLVTDQRVHRCSQTLSRKGLKVTLVGRVTKSSLPLTKREYRTHRFKLLFEKGPLFYAAYNVRLFIFLLFRKVDLLIANDLDTLAANYMLSRIKRVPLVYDSHEYFTGVPELQTRPNIRAVWKWMERRILPKLKYMYTVNESIASLYKNEYGINSGVIRNLPYRHVMVPENHSRKDLGLPIDKKMLLFQGAGINIQRGAEEILETMQYLDDCFLVFVGGGDVIETLKKKTIALDLGRKVFFFPKMPMDELRRITGLADLGLSLDKDTNINYRYSLPNKIFDYIQACVPVFASDLPEIRKVIEHYNIGKLISSHDPQVLASEIKDFFNDSARLALWKENLKFAAEELCWEKEEKILIDLIKDVI
ncbi:MAG TPA: glycosyltransferase [Bacteroidia bacterium]|nr:glycosyltransferase [Bacteroidia bacterium]